MHKFVITSFLSLLSLNLLAQSNNRAEENIKSESIIKVSSKKQNYKFFSGNAPVTMADGTTKPMADVKLGEHVKTCKNGKSTTTQVKQIDVYNEPNSSLTAVYLRPVDTNRESGHQQIVPALLLEATPDHLVQTKRGKKRMSRLSKRDVLYHYEPSTGLVSFWKVGAVKQNARTVSKAYNLATEDGTYLVDNVMVANN